VDMGQNNYMKIIFSYSRSRLSSKLMNKKVLIEQSKRKFTLDEDQEGYLPGSTSDGAFLFATYPAPPTNIVFLLFDVDSSLFFLFFFREGF
jgi:hypothetical protein